MVFELKVGCILSVLVPTLGHMESWVSKRQDLSKGSQIWT